MIAIDEFFASHTFSDETCISYRRGLTLLEGVDDLAGLSAANLLALVKSQNWGNSQEYVALCACRSYLAWAYGPNHPALSARIKRIRPRKQRVLTAKQALTLLASFDRGNAKGLRDLAICALALDTGLRCSELIRLRVADLDLEGQKLQVICKGGQWGTAIFSHQTALYLTEWLAVRPWDTATVFCSVKQKKALTRFGLKAIVRAWGEKMDMQLSPHDLRRSFATLATIFGAPSRVVQVAGRWSNVSMVERYTQGLTVSEIEPYLPLERLSA